MRRLLPSLILLVSVDISALCLPDTEVRGVLPTSEIRKLEDIAEEVVSNFSPLFRSSEELVVVFQAANPRINAEIMKTEDGLVLELYGGMLGHPKMKPDTFRLLLCHEIGHALGGPPLKSRMGWSSTEGQADYYSGKNCARYLGMDESALIDGALALTEIYAEVMGQPAPRLDTCESRVVERTNYGYPPPQCRLQTILAGWKEGPRPRCWFRE